MVAPVTGPFTQEIGGSGSPQPFYSYRSGWKQSRPIDRVLPYTRRVGSTISAYTNTGTGKLDARYWSATDWTDARYTGSWDPLVSAVYEKLKNQISDRANMLVNLAESQQSLTMIAKRATEFYRFTRQLSRGDLVGAARTVRLAAVPKGASVKKSAANNFLEYHFGWSPLIRDIGSAIDILQQPVKACYVKARRRDAPFRVDLAAPVDRSNPTAWYPANLREIAYSYILVDKGIAMGAEVSVSNPNLWLANQLGFVNPAVFLYEKIPFSFVADWFFNVEQFLSSGTDFYGLTLRNAWTTTRVAGSYLQRDFRTYRWTEGSNTVYGGGLFSSHVGSFVQIRRSPGLTLPGFFVRPFKLWGWQRAATAVSLITQKVIGR